MRMPKWFGCNKRSLNIGIGPSDRQPRVDNYLYSKQTSRQPKISNVVLKGYKRCKTIFRSSVDKKFNFLLICFLFFLATKQAFAKKI